MSSNTTFVEGIAIWSPGLPGWPEAQRILRGELAVSERAPSRPAPELLPPNERRRAPDTVALALEVASKACAHAGRKPANLPSVFSSTHGDIAIADYMCRTLAQTPDLVSPTKFHNSVHNAAAGYWAIATGSMMPYTALSAGQSSFAVGLIEALVQVQSDNTEVLYVAYDTEACGPLASMAKSTGRLGCALVLSPRATGNTHSVLEWQTIEEETSQISTSDGNFTHLVAGNAMRSCLPLFEALAGTRNEVSFAIGPKLALKISVEHYAERHTS